MAYRSRWDRFPAAHDALIHGKDNRAASMGRSVRVIDCEKQAPLYSRIAAVAR